MPGRPVPPYPKPWLFPIPLGSRQFRIMLLRSARFGYRPDRLFGRPLVYHAAFGFGPVLRDPRLLVTVHDLTFLTHPEWHPFRWAWLLQQTVPNAARQADHVLTGSEFVRRQVIDLLGVPPARVQAAPMFVGTRFKPMPLEGARAHLVRRFGLDGPFVLNVGTIEPRKNQTSVLAAFERLRRAGFPGRLVIAGRDGWRVEPIHARFDAHRMPTPSCISPKPMIPISPRSTAPAPCSYFHRSKRAMACRRSRPWAAAPPA
jgi:glycosyltransferase involved in cell wall biosynthesis